jgi:hypothetical protein
MDELSEIFFSTIFYILPIGGATYTIGKIFYRIKGIKEKGSKSFCDYAKLARAFILYDLLTSTKIATKKRSYTYEKVYRK